MFVSALISTLIVCVSANSDFHTRPHVNSEELSTNQYSLTNRQNGAILGHVNLTDGRKVVSLTYAGILAKDTGLKSYMDITLRQITDGKKVILAVLDPSSNVMDCDISFDQMDIASFNQDFMTTKLEVPASNSTFVSRSEFDQKLEKMINIGELIEKCHVYQKDKNGRGVPRRSLKGRAKRSVVFPGTKWCGKGDQASHYMTLGNNAGTDRCCRQHDHCPYTIRGFTSKYGIFNYRFHTVSHCDCDYSFRTCLKMSGTGAANMIGSIYFNVVRLPCFIFVQKRACVQRTWWGKCEKHEQTYVAEVQEALDYYGLA